MFVCYNAFMINNDTSSCIHWQWTACAVVTACIDIGLFVGGAYYLSSQPTIAYSLLGAGAFTLGALIYIVVKACHQEADLPKTTQKPVAQDPVFDTPEPVPIPLEEKPNPPPVALQETVLQKNLHYQPDERLLESYAQSVGNKENALKLLKKVGDYVIFNMIKDNFDVAYVDDDRQIKVVSFTHPLKVNGNVYKPEYEKFKRPQVPKGNQANSSDLHACMIGFKFLSLVKSLDRAASNSDCDLPMGVLQDFMSWLEKCPKEEIKFRFNPGIFLSVIGHTFGLSGKHAYQFKGASDIFPGTCEVSFEGFSGSLGKKVVMQDIQDYLQFSQFSDATKDKIKKMCEKAYVIDHSYGRPPSDAELTELMNLLDQDIPITVIGGWEGHSVNFTTTKQELFFINKGQHCGISPGLQKFKVGQEITKEVLLQVLQLHHPSDYPNEGSTQNTLSKILKLQYLETIKSSYQKVGCCVFASNRLCLKAAPLLLGEPFEKVQGESKEFTFFNRDRWFNWLMILIKKEQSDKQLETELYFTMFCIFHKLSLKRSYKFNSEIDDRLWKSYCLQFATLKSEREEHPYLQAIADLIAGKNGGLEVFSQNHSTQVELTTEQMCKFYQEKRSR